MKIQLMLAAALAALLMVSNTLPGYAENVEQPTEEWESVTSGDNLSGTAIPGETPAFSAHVEFFHGQGYVVKGTFTEFLPDTSLVRPLYSVDGENWHFCQKTWDLQLLDAETAEDLKYLQNQICLYSSQEPLAAYLAGQLDRFYLKLQITLENGVTYETQTAVINRSATQPIPEELHPVAGFAPAMLVRQWRPFQRYGQYQITVSSDATPEDISSLLPDTLPIEVQLYADIDFVTSAIVDCPVTWKPLSLSQLTPGESVTIADAAEEIVVPGGTLLNTPNGVFELNEPLDVDHDEIRLVLNVVAKNAAPTAALAYDAGGLHIAFHLKPTGAAAIRAYTLSESGTDWMELPAPLLPEEVNAPSSAAGSAYMFVLGNTSEPYQTYLAALNAGEEPAPFFVGLMIEGGVYDGRQLILAWPDTYDLPARLPDLKGSGGNECNAGSDNKGDSTLEGQRPGLPQEPETPQDPKDEPDVQEPESPQDTKDEPDVQEPESPQDTKNEPDVPKPESPQGPKDGEQGMPEPKPPQISNTEQIPQEPEPQPERSPDISPDPVAQQTEQSQISGREPHTLQPEQPQTLEDEAEECATGNDDSAETLPVPAVGAGDTASVPVVSIENGSDVGIDATPKTERRLHRLLLSTAATITIGICIALAVGKMMAGKAS